MKEKTSDRVATRLKVFEPAEMISGQQHWRVHILNISLTGALLHCKSPPVVGQSLTLRCGSLAANASVAWSEDSRFGIAFAVPLSDAALLSVVAPPSA